VRHQSVLGWLLENYHSDHHPDGCFCMIRAYLATERWMAPLSRKCHVMLRRRRPKGSCSVRRGPDP